MQKRNTDLSRLEISFAAAALVILILALPLAVNGADKRGPIKIGMDTELTGVASETSNNVKMGYDLFLQEVGHKVAGRELSIIESDNKTDPKVSMEAAQKLVERDKVHILGFGTNSACALPVRGYIEKMKVPFVVVGLAGAEQINLPPSKYVTRISYADGQGEVLLGRYAAEKLGYKRMTLMGPDFSGSTGKLWSFQQEFEKYGGKIVQTILWPIGDMDLAPYFAQLKPGIDAIFPFIPGDISINRFMAQYLEMGLDKKGIKLCTHWTMTEDYLPLKTFGEKMLGFISFSYYAVDYDTPENKRVTKLYYDKYGKNKMMNLDISTGYESMKFIYTALQSINGDVEDSESFLKAMHATKINGICSKSISLDQNGNVIRDWLIRQVQKKDGVVKNVVITSYPQCRQPPMGYTIMPQKGK